MLHWLIEGCHSANRYSENCRVDAAGVVLTVASPRGELEEHSLPDIFERFWRKDAARDEDGQFVLRLAGFTAVSTWP